MKLNELRVPKNSKKTKKRFGKGDGSGIGKTSGRGMNGQKSRSGGSIPVWFEGGQMPIHRRIPRKGFTNIFKKEFRIVSLNKLAQVEEEIIDIDIMEKFGLIKTCKTKKLPVKILGNKENQFNERKIIKANKFTKSAIAIIEKNGGKAEVL
ncbi:MAG: 50S ribosomal protein L15 [Candidatus Cloacimonadota bacterium]|nr:50S ribosomal protein L15 [Candidatus Cloacimonadota bacterium]